MVIFHDPQCAEYGSSMRPEQPARITRSAAQLRETHPAWDWRMPSLAAESVLLLAHTPAHLKRLTQPHDFDGDTPFFPAIYDHARRGVGAAIDATKTALGGDRRAFSLMRPPGHHATASQAMGFCYLSTVAIAVLYAQRDLAANRVAVWDFDAHHGNGTEAILQGRPNVLFTSVHQSPCYPGTGLSSFENCLNWPIPPRVPPDGHLKALRESLDRILAFEPDLIVVSAGFDAYVDDPITSMTLRQSDFATLGGWLADADLPTAAVLEGGYSPDLPLLIDAFLTAWDE